MQKVSKSIEETREIAKIFRDEILKEKNSKGGALVVCLSGDLGAGKTAFTKEIAKHLGIKTKVDSPTFVIMKKYTVKLKGYKFFYHMDAYRLKNEKELTPLKFEDVIGDDKHLVFIEWPENISKAIPKHSRKIKITQDKKGNRKFKLS